ncbi:hypothetical protein M514_20427 [Trichuris suis]|uniref:Uncharacterized protein n=1 Tax=Trichuris suis TaxID=68888 RepID=A0A085NA24_9BILA|nr:hypothetical protein M513_09496 [Trichuris suis]KFD59869.1 hypothetical protein M514_09496 [Trichuris suis]KFD66320.1 hypothetical protein M514_21607 [Trichuris suis]KFD67391.1 hypothetical protein M514_20427 [Trichuris suis]
MPLSAHSPRPKIICRESFFHLRRIKEAPYIKSNSTINRDNGVPASEVWGALINEFQCCDFAELITCIVPMCLFKHLFHSTADGGTRSVLKYTWIPRANNDSEKLYGRIQVASHHDAEGSYTKATRKYGVTCKMATDWKNQEEALKTLPKKQHSRRSGSARWTELENDLAE